MHRIQCTIARMWLYMDAECAVSLLKVVLKAPCEQLILKHPEMPHKTICSPHFLWCLSKTDTGSYVRMLLLPVKHG